MKIVPIVLCAALGAFLSRWHGGGFFETPKVLKNAAWALPFGLSSFYVTFGLGVIPAAVFGLISFGLCLIGKATGHGGGMDLGHSKEEPGQGRKAEKLEYLILKFHGKIPQYWYDALLLALCGVAAVSGAIIAFGYTNPLLGALVFLGGAAKAPAYMLGWSLSEDDATEIGELLTGFFAYGALAAAVVV